MMFLCTLFVVFNFGSLRSSTRRGKRQFSGPRWRSPALGRAVFSLLTEQTNLDGAARYLFSKRFATMSVVHPDHRALHVSRDILKCDASVRSITRVGPQAQAGLTSASKSFAELDGV